jgi:DNA-binding SARP family transcriptional activator
MRRHLSYRAVAECANRTRPAAPRMSQALGRLGPRSSERRFDSADRHRLHAVAKARSHDDARGLVSVPMETVVTGRLRFAVLGPLRGWSDETELELGSPQQSATLAALLVRGGDPATVGQLVDAVWGDAPPRTAVGTLRTYISRLRRVLRSGGGERSDAVRLDSVGDGYGLHLPDGALDLVGFERVVAAAQADRAAGNLLAAAYRLRRALQMWCGVPLSGVPGPYAGQQRERLSELRLAVLGNRLDLDLELGRHADLTGELMALTSEYPLRERFREQLMLALYRSGRQAEALGVYQDVRRVLTDKLGIEPGAALQDLHQRILTTDPGLMAESARLPAPVSVRPAPKPAVDIGDYAGRLYVELRG